VTDTRKRSAHEPGGDERTALVGALASLLEPIAVLAVSRGLSFAAVEDLLKAAFVENARRAQPESAGQRIVSRVATATGLTRREVTRLLEAPRGLPPPRPSPATQVFTRWRADPALRDKRGNVVALRRQGPAPSFEALARSITQDVHPRSLLDELCRLGLAVEDGDDVQLVRDSVVASRGSERAYGFLAGNVGDHLRAGVANVLAEAPPHVEQAVFADGLSAESLVLQYPDHPHDVEALYVEPDGAISRVVEGWNRIDMEELGVQAGIGLFREGDNVPAWKAG